MGELLHRGDDSVVGAQPVGDTDREITTQQAAEILGVSRPTVVRLITDGELKAHIPGAERRKLFMAGVLTYREELDARRNQFIAESSAAYDEAEPGDMAGLLAEARGAHQRSKCRTAALTPTS